MPNAPMPAPDPSSIGSASFRAMHVRFDPPPHVLEDELSLRLVDPTGAMKPPPGMEPEVTGPLRASIVVRARFIEDLVAERAAAGVTQYVILGAGLDTFAQRRPELASRLQVFELDRPAPQAWKRQRLEEMGLGIPPWLHLVPVDFEVNASWLAALAGAGFQPDRPAVVACTGVSMYLTREANAALLREGARLAPGSSLVLSFALPAGPGGRVAMTCFDPAELQALAREAGFKATELVTAAQLSDRYLAGRADGLRAGPYQDLLIAGI